MNCRIVVVGSLNLDLVVETARFPSAGETVPGNTLRSFCGGKGANQAFAAARLGAEVTMLGQAGNDAAGDSQLRNLNSAGVETRWIARDPKQPTGTALIAVDANRENRIIVVPGANGTFLPAILERGSSAFERAALVLLQLEIPMATVEAAARLALRNGARIILDPAPAVPLSDELLAATEYLTPNLSELGALTGHRLDEQASGDEIVAAARTLIARGVAKVIAKLGGRGAMLVTRESAVAWPAHTVTAVDTTAAGDAFNGAFATRLAEGAGESEAALFASAAAAISVTRAGAQASVPARSEVEEFLRSRRSEEADAPRIGGVPPFP